MKKILVPTDFSTNAEDALKVAANLAKKHNSEIYVLHMLNLPVHLFDDSDTIPNTFSASSDEGMPEAIFYMNIVKKRFQEVLAADYLEGISVHDIIQNHQIFSGINDTAKKHDIDLIVMGSQGASGVEEMIIGSNTEKVVRTSDVPVLVIKEEQPNFDIKEIVFPCNFTEEYANTFKHVIDFAKLLDAKLNLLFVNTPRKFTTTTEANSRMEKYIHKFNLTNYTTNIYNDTSIEKGILNFSEKLNADLIAMSTHGRKGLSHFFNGSLSEDLVNHAKRPVATFKM